MSKRVVIAVLISLVVIAAVFTSVQALGVLRKAGSGNVASRSVDNRALGKANRQGLDSYFFDDGMDSGHECGKDPSVDY